MGGDQEEGGETDCADGVGRDELEGEQQGEVAGRDHGIGRQVGLAARDREHGGRPEHEDAQHDGGRLLVREVDHCHGRESNDRDREAGDREHHDRACRLDRNAPHQATSLSRTRTVRSLSATRAAPAESIAQSTGLPWRPSTNVWWYSSVAA